MIIALGLVLLCDAITAKAAVPDDAITKGVYRNITVDRICATVWGKDVRHVTAAMKQQVFKSYDMTGNNDAKCIPDKNGRRCEIDHRAPRCLGGDDVVENLWAQPYGGTCNAAQKDHLEDKLHDMVCDNLIDLEDAQAVFLGDWREGYKTYIDPKGCGDD